MDPNRLTDLRDKLEEIRARRGDPRATEEPRRRTSSVLPFDGKSRFVLIAAIMMAALFYLF
jgi:hypothetical protein